MYQNCCKKCGSVDLHTEAKGNNTGLYCSDCGAWVKWISKDEFRAFKHSRSVKETKYKMCPNADMAIYILDFIKRSYEKALDKEGVQKYVEALQMGIDALEKTRGV